MYAERENVALYAQLQYARLVISVACVACVRLQTSGRSTRGHAAAPPSPQSAARLRRRHHRRRRGSTRPSTSVPSPNSSPWRSAKSWSWSASLRRRCSISLIASDAAPRRTTLLSTTAAPRTCSTHRLQVRPATTSSFASFRPATPSSWR